MKEVKKRIIGYLTHLANKETKAASWYAIKNRIAEKYGEPVGYDVQFLDGKKCYSCNGTGIWRGYYGTDLCRNCWNGWYKSPVWVVLQRVKIGNYVFHQPLKRVYRPQEIEVPHTVVINGYIEHTKHKYGWLGLFILFMIYDSKQYWKLDCSLGRGWRLYWYWPRNWVHSVFHLCRYKSEAIPFNRYRQRKRAKQYKPATPCLDDDLPF